MYYWDETYDGTVVVTRDYQMDKKRLRPYRNERERVIALSREELTTTRRTRENPYILYVTTLP